MCNQLETVSLECTVDSCNGQRVSWMHTDTTGKLLRYLPGQQTLNVNTLTIHTTSIADSGYYSCINVQNQDFNVLTSFPITVSFANDVRVIDGGTVQLKVRGNIFFTFNVRTGMVFHIQRNEARQVNFNRPFTGLSVQNSDFEHLTDCIH